MKQVVTTSYGKAKVYRVGSGQMVMVVPGFSESITHNKELVDTLATQGYNVYVQPTATKRFY